MVHSSYTSPYDFFFLLMHAARCLLPAAATASRIGWLLRPPQHPSNPIHSCQRRRTMLLPAQLPLAEQRGRWVLIVLANLSLIWLCMLSCCLLLCFWVKFCFNGAPLGLITVRQDHTILFAAECPRSFIILVMLKFCHSVLSFLL